MARVTLLTGASRFIVEDVDSIDDILALYKETHNIPDNATATVNSKVADPDYELQDDDEVAFTKTSGQKG